MNSWRAYPSIYALVHKVVGFIVIMPLFLVAPPALLFVAVGKGFELVGRYLDVLGCAMLSWADRRR